MYQLPFDHPDIEEIERFGYPKSMLGRGYWDEDGMTEDDDEDSSDD